MLHTTKQRTKVQWQQVAPDPNHGSFFEMVAQLPGLIAQFGSIMLNAIASGSPAELREILSKLHATSPALLLHILTHKVKVDSPEVSERGLTHLMLILDRSFGRIQAEGISDPRYAAELLKFHAPQQLLAVNAEGRSALHTAVSNQDFVAMNVMILSIAPDLKEVPCPALLLRSREGLTPLEMLASRGAQVVSQSMRALLDLPTMLVSHFKFRMCVHALLAVNMEAQLDAVADSAGALSNLLKAIITTCLTTAAVEFAPLRGFEDASRTLLMVSNYRILCELYDRGVRAEFEDPLAAKLDEGYRTQRVEFREKGLLPQARARSRSYSRVNKGWDRSPSPLSNLGQLCAR